MMLLLSVSALCSPGQPSVPQVKTLVVMPFENRSSAPGLEWIAEAFPQLLGERLASDSIYVLSREYRLHAYDRAGIPSSLHPSQATLYRIAEQMDVNYMVIGSYAFDGQTFSASARLLDMKRRQLSPLIQESGKLPQLLSVQTALSWDLLRLLQPSYSESRAAFLAAAPPIRLDAFENDVRGLIAPSEAEKLQRLRTAVRLNPSYPEAMLELGKTYLVAHDYDAAANWLGRIPNTDSLAREANFFLGLAAYSQGNLPRAQAAFRYLLEQFPLIEVYNNLGVVSARLGKPDAQQWFQKAVNGDPSDADYRFNLALALLHAGDREGAGRQLRECLALEPGDNEAKTLLAGLAVPTSGTPTLKPAEASSSPAALPAKLPLPRIKRNYDESAFRQLALEMQNASESRLAKLDPHAHAAFHVQRGRDLLAKGFSSDAVKELREAVDLDQSSALAHAALAEALELDQDAAGARAESNAALRLNPAAEVYVVLARTDLRENNRDSAVELLNRALQMDPGNAEGLALKQRLDREANTLPQVTSKP